MRVVSLLVLGVSAAAVLSTPAMSAQRKTLFDHLFPKAYEKRQKRLRAQQQPVEVPKIAKTRYYAYKTPATSFLEISPLAVVVAKAEVQEETDQVVTASISSETPKQESTQFTKDLQLAGLPKLGAEKYISAAVSDHYNEKQQYHWVDEAGDWKARARAAIKLFETADEFGLRNSDYHLSVAPPAEQTEEALASFRLNRELQFSIIALRYAIDASYGTINANRISGYHDLPVNTSKAPAMYAKIMGGALPANTLRAFHPQNEKFDALKQELAQLKHQEDDSLELPEKVLIKPGKSHDALPKFIAAIQKRGSQELLANHTEVFAKVDQLASAPSVDGKARAYDKYDQPAVALVKAYQKEAGLGADGIIGPATARKLMGVGKSGKVRRVVLAMERLRWLPHNLGSRHVFINQPEFRARYINAGEEELSMKVVVGKKSNQTNFFFDEIEKVVYNPYWGVPKSILVNEYLPKLRANPGYFDQIGYEVATARGKVSSTSVNWNSIGANPSVSVRQPPGPKNALGEVKILFPNKHHIYMHDTPSKHLFKKDYRAYSHGCIRLHDPKGMAAAVLGKSKNQITASISTGKNATEHLKQTIPVYVSYFTAWPQKDGTIKYFGDMYDRDVRLWKAMEAT